MTSEELIQEILAKVAAGQLAPEAAAEQLEAARHTGVVAVAEAVRRVRIEGGVVPTKILGDIHIKDAVATGPHRASTQGDTLVVSGLPLSDHPGFSFHWPNWPGRGGFGTPEQMLQHLQVRMNPELALEVELAAGLLTIQGVTGPIKADVQAGSAKVEGFRGPIDLSVNWGTVSASGILQTGDSKIRCEAGTVRVRLERGSSVTVVARSTLGRIALPGDGAGIAEGWTVGGSVREVKVGGGEARLEVETTTGAVWVEEA